MGTSQSSSGPGAGVALVPPWAADLPTEPEPESALDSPPEHSDSSPDNTDPADPQPSDTGETPPEPATSPLAGPGRFRDARRSLGSFARRGDTVDLRRAVGHYVSRGYGGANTMGRRLAATSATASRLGAVVTSGQSPDGTDLRDQVLASGADANQIVDAIVEAVRPVDGTQDAEASRRAVRDALSDLLDQFPDADPLALDADQRDFVIERYTALDVYNRFALDMQRTVIEKAPDATTALSRMKQIQAYIREQVAAGFRRVRDRGATPTSQGVAAMVRSALAETLLIFEEYLR